MHVCGAWVYVHSTGVEEALTRFAACFELDPVVVTAVVAIARKDLPGLAKCVPPLGCDCNKSACAGWPSVSVNVTSNTSISSSRCLVGVLWFSSPP